MGAQEFTLELEARSRALVALYSRAQRPFTPPPRPPRYFSGHSGQPMLFSDRPEKRFKRFPIPHSCKLGMDVPDVRVAEQGSIV
jgi:hypothetical protein